MSNTPPYELHRSSAEAASEPTTEYSDPVYEGTDDSFLGGVTTSSVLTASPYPYKDATQNVVEMHLALLYLLSNPEEFQNAIQYSGNHHYSLSEWNETNTDCGASTTISIGDSTVENSSSPPLPFVVFCDDAEVVLPQAHTASQLFGIERMEGIELEAAAGIHSLSVLFLRWLALMPGGDHLNIIDPPGLTVMRIAGGRYRVTAAHRVVWTWMNEFANLEAVADVDFGNESTDGQNNDNSEEPAPLQVGDLVTMTIVDVFETDNNGRLLSYCPTFDNRQVHKTTARVETLRKSSSQLKKSLTKLSKSTASKKIQTLASQGLEAGLSTARSVASGVFASPIKSKTPKALDVQGFEKALTEAEQATTKQEENKPEAAGEKHQQEDAAGEDEKSI
eukprot:CAMPEP_0178924264 /NCGR_PEP_ID=MMETSP0786-20121207/17226_1 /TAXON_ID=186022 /ORGANISM="Thalassionema frauenfeldii, Strain CCMP 1798" /LENGTH=391 /DNA_ID=CAMNT_0020598947 /DNA_START=108 /DNA_END=1283 /DNA_ORIENTATION=+